MYTYVTCIYIHIRYVTCICIHIVSIHTCQGRREGSLIQSNPAHSGEHFIHTAVVTEGKEEGGGVDSQGGKYCGPLSER